MFLESSKVNACEICGETHGHRFHYPHEMMFGTNEVFEYMECGYCGCLQITHIPDHLERYYPEHGYYSYKQLNKKKLSGIVAHLRMRRTKCFLGEYDPIGFALSKISKESEHFRWFRRGSVSIDSKIADIGCGSGRLLLKLQRDGFRNLLGIDPYIKEDINYGSGLRVLKRSIYELDGVFDYLMLHHSFEHMPYPVRVLEVLRKSISSRGTLLIRIPVADCFARRKYGIHWMAWDAPRHLFLHTVRSMHVLAERTGFRIMHLEYDSSLAQFASSELYLRGIPFKDQTRFQPGRSTESFTQAEWDDYGRWAKVLNSQRDGDTACFYLAPEN